jgi:hypothetical protein
VSAAGVYERCPGYADTGEVVWAGRPGVSEGGGSDGGGDGCRCIEAGS